MPDPSIIALFVTASVALLVVPGPTTALVVARSLSGGGRIALPLVLGVGLGDLVAATVSLAGAGALLAASATAFTVVKIVGAVYLIWLGIRLYRSEPMVSQVTGHGERTGAIDAFRDGFLVTVFNPKGILFFAAFVPQFIDAGRPYATQAVFFVVTFTLLGILNGAAYATGANAMRRVLAHSGALRAMNRAGGVTIAAAGIAALFARRPVA